MKNKLLMVALALVLTSCNTVTTQTPTQAVKTPVKPVKAQQTAMPPIPTVTNTVRKALLAKQALAKEPLPALLGVLTTNVEIGWFAPVSDRAYNVYIGNSYKNYTRSYPILTNNGGLTLLTAVVSNLPMNQITHMTVTAFTSLLVPITNITTLKGVSRTNILTEMDSGPDNDNDIVYVPPGFIDLSISNGWSLVTCRGLSNLTYTLTYTTNLNQPMKPAGFSYLGSNQMIYFVVSNPPPVFYKVVITNTAGN